MAVSPPFTKVKRTSTIQVDSTPLVVYGSDNASFIDSIFVCNTNDKEIFVSFKTLEEREHNNQLIVTNPQLYNFIPVGPYETKAIVPTDILNMEPGDLLYGYSSYSGDTFDCHVCYRELTEVVV